MYWRSWRALRSSGAAGNDHRSRQVQPTTAPLTKFVLFTSNCLFWIISICLLVSGLYAWIKKGTLYNMGRLVSDRTLFFDPAWFLIIMSTVTALVTLIGCVGVLRENSQFLLVYIWLVSIAFTAEVLTIALGYLFKNEAKKHVGSGMMESLSTLYHDDEDLQDLVDWVQASWLKCCGVQSYRDWEINAYYNCSSAVLGNVMACGVPHSCCRLNGTETTVVVNRQCGFGKLHEPVAQKLNLSIYIEGCLNKLSQWFEDRAVLLMCLALVIAVIQLIGIGFAYSLRSKIGEQRRRHLLRNRRFGNENN
ncbi:hypothetical protein ACOME3_007643 [Neoechinorhynchus agilis]